MLDRQPLDSLVKASDRRIREDRIPIQSTVDTARPQRIFGQPNGLLPSISPPPPPPAILTRSIQQNVPTRFSSPFSPPEDQNNPVNRGMGQEGELDSHGPHTSTSGPLDGATAYQRVLQTHSSARQVNIIRQNTPLPDFQEDFEESDTESPSPSKRRIGRDYGHQAPKKRMRSALNHSHGQNLDDGRYLSQEQPSRLHLRHLKLVCLMVITRQAWKPTSKPTKVNGLLRRSVGRLVQWKNGRMLQKTLTPSPTVTELTAELERVMDMVKTFMAQVVSFAAAL
ncbi:hypothetical protein RhiXN_00317 [Rhizoctonia solani]|uniref:Uncharacterized protein n=1 Tax=Rhizoctonia solani TaxID=456999 RepID=A0A8H8SUH1_9AGAM|nr:uncharacterized protein RhiXN_00317 [Rhizoctonia solani]QRW18911.1 hypothetical protein RhiXN_00317 [Rhizoctonia solani]